MAEPLADADNPFLKVAGPAVLPDEDNPFLKLTGPPAKPDVSSGGAFVRAAGRSALPAAAGLAGAGAGAEIGAAAGAFGGPFAPVTVPVGAFIGGLGGFFLGSTAMEKAQDHALSKFPESWKETIGQDDRQRRLDEMHAPIASFMGGLAPYALTMRPGGFSRAALPENATAFQRIMAHPATSRVFGGAAMGGIEATSEFLGEEPMDWRKVAISTGFGVVFNKPTKFGEALHSLGARPVRAGLGAVARPTVAQADDAGVIGPGITEETFRGVQKRAEEWAAASAESVRQEAALLGDTAADEFGRRGFNVHDTARRMQPDLFTEYDDLTARRDTLRTWVDTIGGKQAEVHLAATEGEIEKLEPQVQAAYRRAGESIGAPFHEEAPETPAASPATAPPAQIDNTHDVVSGAVASKDPNGPVYVDRHIPELSPKLTDKTGQPANLHKYLAVHETNEREAMARGMSYADAHNKVATPAERAAVEADGVNWGEYTKEIDGYLDHVETEKEGNPPPDPHVDPDKAIIGDKPHHHSHAKEAAAATPATPAATAQPAAEPPYATAEHKAAIAADVERQLIAAGRPAEEAKAAAAIVAARYVSRATWLRGAAGTAKEMYDVEGAEIRGPGAASAGGRQSPMRPAPANELELLQRAQGSIKPQPGYAGPGWLGPRPIVTIMREGNASTAIHEFGHDFLEQLMRDSAHDAAPDQLKADAAAVQAWVRAKPDGTITRGGHERFARGFEQYLREGRAPSKELAGVFAKFKQWLVSIYQTLKGLGAPISDDIRRVFDRMLAAEPQRTVIAPEEARGPTLQDIHEADAAEHAPQTAEPAARLVASERARYAENQPPEIANELEKAAQRQAAATGAEPAANEGAGAGGPSEVVGDRGGSGAESEGGGGGAESREERGGGNEAVGQGAEPAAAGRAEPAGDGTRDNPLAAKPADQFEPGPNFNVGKDGNVRAENITSVPQLVAAINEASERIGGGGPLTMGEMQSLADAVLLPVEKIDEAHLARVFGGIQNLSSKVWALRQAIRDSAAIVSDAMKKAAASQDPADLAAMAVAMTRHDMMQSLLSSVTTETGRALGMGFRNLEGWEKAADLGLFLKQNTGRTLYQLQQIAKLGANLQTPGQIAKFLRDAQKRSFGRMLLEYWINGLISGPITHITYVLGNAALSFEKAVPESLIAAAIGKALGHTGGVRFGETPAQLRGFVRGLPGAFESMIEAARTGQTTLLPGEEGRPLTPFEGDTVVRVARSATNDPVKWREVGAQTFGLFRGIKDAFIAGDTIGRSFVHLEYSPLGAIPDIAVGPANIPLGTTLRLPGRGVAAIHSFFRSLNYSMVKSAEAYRQASNEGLTGTAFDTRLADLWQNPNDAMMERARSEATEATLMGQGGSWTKKLSALMNNTADLPVLGETAPLKFIDPFVHISSNIIRQALMERTPFGLAFKEIRSDLAGKNGQVAQEMAAARMLAGSALGLLFGGLAMQGYATGSGPSDPAKQAMWRVAGYQPHSIRIGDLWFDVHRLGPLGMLMGVAADMYDVAHAATKEDLGEVGAKLQHAFAQNILDESFMRGPADLIKAIEEPERFGARYVRDRISSFVPFSVGQAQIARMSDPYSREVRSLMDSIKAKVPGMSEQLFPRRDVWGEAIPNLQGFGEITAIYMRRISQDPVNQAMLRLGIAPAKLERKIRNVELSDAQYDDFARTAGRMTKMRLDQIVRSPDWSIWPAHVQHDVIAETIRQSREAGRGMMMMRFPEIAREAVDFRMKKHSDDSVVPVH